MTDPHPPHPPPEAAAPPSPISSPSESAARPPVAPTPPKALTSPGKAGAPSPSALEHKSSGGGGNTNAGGKRSTKKNKKGGSSGASVASSASSTTSFASVAETPAEVWARVDTVVPWHFLEDCPRWRLPGRGDWTIQGHSVAGERTGFHVPELRMFLDGGMNSYKGIEGCFVTHTHSDHSSNLPCVAMGEMGMLERRPTVFVPREGREPLRLLARASSALNRCCPLEDRDEMNTVGVSPGDEFIAKLGKKASTQVAVRVVECCHTVPCVGYVFSSVANKLRAELRGQPSAEIKKRRLAGEPVTEQVHTPVFAFLGDTTPEVFDEARNPGLLDVPTIFVECTGVKPDQPEMASRGHTRWEDLRKVIAAHPATTFVIMHMSRGVKEREALEIFVASGLRNVVVWFDSGVVELAHMLPEEAVADAGAASPDSAAGGASSGAGSA